VDGEDVVAVAPIPEVDGHVHKIEGLALRGLGRNEVHLLAVVDDDDPEKPSACIELRADLT
jgi:hypothetical protein